MNNKRKKKKKKTMKGIGLSVHLGFMIVADRRGFVIRIGER